MGEGLVRRCVAEEIGRIVEAKEAEETPEFIGLDEFSVRKQRLYHTAICNLEEGEVMEVVEGQDRQKIEEYLDKLPQPERVKGVAMDMHEPFRQAVQMCLPQAKVVVDKFHLIKKIAHDSPPEFKELLHTLGNWRGEILNYFDYRITNGFVEGKNNRIKTIKRMAYGYRNMDSFRLRILATNPRAAGSEFHTY